MKRTPSCGLLLISLTVAAAFMSTVVWAQQADAEYNWVFDIKDGPNLDVNVMIAIYPGTSNTWSSYTMTTEGNKVENITARDEVTGDLLRVEILFQTETRASFRVRFSDARGNGYKFRIFWRELNRITSSTAELSFDWNWGGKGAYPQTVRIVWPEKYDTKSLVSEGNNLEYTKSADQGRNIIEFKGTNPAGKLWRWTATAQLA